MKRFISLLLMLGMAASLFAGCGPVDSDKPLVSVGKKGKVQTVDVETFDKSYYTQEEFQTFAQEAIDAYNKSHEVDAVTLKSFTVEEEVAKLKMEYKSVSDYSSFNDIKLYQGSIADAMVAGYLFDTNFSKVEKGAITGKANKTEIFETEGLQVVIIGANTDVQIDGTILYVSTANVTVTDKDSVSIQNEDETSLESDVDTYIIYK